MQELLGRLQALDPQAGAELRIVAHFDALVTGRVGLEAMLRAAVTLSGGTAGFRDHDRTITIDPQGRRHDHGVGPTAAMPRRVVRGGGEVWLARSGPVSPSEEMVLERLALAVEINGRRRAASVDRDPLLVVIDPSADETERATAITALRLSDRRMVRVVALAADQPAPADHRTVLVGFGEHRLRAVLDVDHDPWAAGRRAGLGSPGKPNDLPQSWRSAVAAYRLAGALLPVVDAEQIGILASLGSGADALPDSSVHGSPQHDQPDPDQLRLTGLMAEVGWVAPTVEALVLTTSRRSAASALGVHHATLQARAERLTAALGYDVTTPIGALRLSVSYLKSRLDGPW